MGGERGTALLSRDYGAAIVFYKFNWKFCRFPAIKSYADQLPMTPLYCLASSDVNHLKAPLEAEFPVAGC